MRRCWIIFALALLASSGCGYHVAGRAVALPESVKTVAIPSFVNKTDVHGVETLLTAAVVREFGDHRCLRLVNDPASADAVLHGVVKSAQMTPMTYDSITGRASSGLVTVVIAVELVDRNGKPLYKNDAFLFREQYQISRELSSFFEEQNPALERMSRDFARALAGGVLEAF